MCLDDTDSPSQRSQNEKQWYYFQLKEVSSQNVALPRLSGCEERQGVCGPLVLGGVPAPGASLGSPQSFAQSEKLHMRLQPPTPPLPTHKKDPKLLYTNIFIFIPNFYVSETWRFDALFILKSNLTPSHTAQMFLHFSYFDFLLM